MKIGKTTTTVIREEMTGLKGSEAKAKALDLAKRFNISMSRVYELTSDLRTRARRSDKGKFKLESVLSEQQIAMLLKMTMAGCIAESVIEVAEESNLIPKGVISPARYNAWLKSNDVNRARLEMDTEYRPRFEAPYANFIWQVDYTTAEFFYLNGQLRVEYEHEWSVNKNRKGNQRTRIHLFSAYDQYSRLCYIEFMPGGSSIYWLDFLFNAMRKKWDNYPFHGVPKIIATDNDSVVKSRIYTSAMDKLGVKIWKHAPGASWSKGVVESGFRKFQARQAVSQLQAIPTIEEWNQFAYDKMLQFGNKIHAAHKRTPIDAWLESIKNNPSALRAVPDAELYDTLKWDEHERYVANDLTIEFKGATIQLPQEQPFFEMIKRKITFYTHAVEGEMIKVLWADKIYDVRVAPRKTYAPGQSPELNIEETKRSKLIRQAEETELPQLKLYGKFIERHKDDKYLVRTAEEFDESRIDARLARTLDIETAIEKLKIAGVFPERLELHQREFIERFFAERNNEVGEYDIDELAKEIKAGRIGAVNMRLVANQ